MPPTKHLARQVSKANSSSDPIAETGDDALFQTERYGMYTYQVPVSSASYDVELFFNELYQTSVGARRFSATVENQAVLTDIDLFAEVGHDTAFRRLVQDVEVSDGNLTIDLTASVDQATLSGFTVYSNKGVLEEPAYPIVPATNPNIWADVPDMSIIRVDDTYYMSSTTMHLSPGVPIMKSTDLKNWEVINYAHGKLDSSSPSLNMNDGNAYGDGTWASSIRHKDGTFYVTSFSYTTNRTYVWRTTNIEGGSWTQSTISPLMHDSSLLFDDDGRNWMAFGSDRIQLVELNAEATAVMPGASPRTIIHSASAVAGNDFILTAEGTQIQKIDGWYYISNICWPRGGPRTQVVHRSRNITGPYEGRVVLSESVDGAGVAQGSYISTPQGEWFLYAFRDSGAAGRMPYLVPVSFQNGWPVVTDGVPSTLDLNVEDRGIQGIVRSDEFDAEVLDIVWQWNHNPDDDGWSLSERPGHLRITNTRTDSSIINTRNSLTQRMYGPTSTASIKLDTSGLKDGDVAGISAFSGDYGLIGVTNSGGMKYIVMINNGTEVDRVLIHADPVYLRASGDFRKQVDRATFAYSTDGVSWNNLGNTFDMVFDHRKHFMGTKFALFNYGTRNTGGYADFDWFHVRD